MDRSQSSINKLLIGKMSSTNQHQPHTRYISIKRARGIPDRKIGAGLQVI